MSSENEKRTNILIGGFVGFLIGLCGNLLAAWIQQDVLLNSFTPIRISIILLCSILCILGVAFLDTHKKTSLRKKVLKGDKREGVFLSRIRLFWSKLRTRGKNIQMEDVTAIDSDIDIDLN